MQLDLSFNNQTSDQHTDSVFIGLGDSREQRTSHLSDQKLVEGYNMWHFL